MNLAKSESGKPVLDNVATHIIWNAPNVTVATATAIMIYTQMDKNKISKAIRKGKSIAKAVKKW